MKVALKSKWGIARVICYTFVSIMQSIKLLLQAIFLPPFSLLAITIFLADLIGINIERYIGCLVLFDCLFLLLIFIFIMKRNVDKVYSSLFLEIENNHVRGSFIPHRLQDIGIPVSSLEKLEIGVVVSSDIEKTSIQMRSHCTRSEYIRILHDQSMYFHVKSGQHFGLEGWRMFEDESLDDFVSFLRKEGVKVFCK